MLWLIKMYNDINSSIRATERRNGTIPVSDVNFQELKKKQRISLEYDLLDDLSELLTKDEQLYRLIKQEHIFLDILEKDQNLMKDIKTLQRRRKIEDLYDRITTLLTTCDIQVGHFDKSTDDIQKVHLVTSENECEIQSLMSILKRDDINIYNKLVTESPWINQIFRKRRKLMNYQGIKKRKTNCENDEKDENVDNGENDENGENGGGDDNTNKLKDNEDSGGDKTYSDDDLKDKII